jgi:hypothetical protein
MVMAYKALVVDAGPDAAAEARVRLAVGLAGRFGAHLLGVAACDVLPVATGPYDYYNPADDWPPTPHETTSPQIRTPTFPNGR